MEPGGCGYPTREWVEGVVTLSVADDGPGIPEEIREQIFFPLVSGREGGSGLVLAVAALPAHAATLKLGHVLPPAHNWHVAASGFADEVKADYATWLKLWPFRDSGPCLNPIAAFMLLNELRTLRWKVQHFSAGTMQVGPVTGEFTPSADPNPSKHWALVAPDTGVTR